MSSRGAMIRAVVRDETDDTEARDRYMETCSFASLDGLRALSIVGVVWFHTTNNSPGWPALRRGFLGVDFFFIISGFLIATLLLRERRNSGIISLKNFYARRILRIVPAFWLMLLVAACIAYMKQGDGSLAIKREIPYALFYVSNLVPMTSLLSITWSLSAEEQFYMIVPALQKYAPRLLPLVLLPIAYFFASLPPFGFFPNTHMPDFFRQTTFGPILAGVMLAYLLDHPRGRGLALSVLRSPLSPLFALALAVLTLSYPGTDISGWPRLTIQWSLLFLLASCVVRERHVLAPALSWGPIRRIGTVSYGIYLYHLFAYWPVSRLLAHLGIQSGYVLFVGVLSLSWLLAELSYRSLELRFLKLKGKFEVRPRTHLPVGATGIARPN
jgi:peptidoglycan/LPS O-acetylase OafA/YrhL